MWQCSDSKHEVDLFEKMGCIILPTRVMSQIFLFFSEPSTFPTHKFLYRIESELTGPSNDWLQGCILFFLLPSARLLPIGQVILHQPGYSPLASSLSISQATLHMSGHSPSARLLFSPLHERSGARGDWGASKQREVGHALETRHPKGSALTVWFRRLALMLIKHNTNLMDNTMKTHCTISTRREPAPLGDREAPTQTVMKPSLQNLMNHLETFTHIL